MASLNKVMMIANLTRDPDLAYTPSGTALCKFGLAVNRQYTTADGEKKEEVCFIETEVWGTQAESCVGYLKKGSMIFVEGRLKLDQWETQGQRRSRHVLIGERIQFLKLEPKKGEDDEQG